MKRIITLVFVACYFALVLTNAAQRKPAKPATTRPTPTPSPRQTPIPAPASIPVTPPVVTPSATPSTRATPTPSPAPTAVPTGGTTPVPAAGTKEPCEDKVLASGIPLCERKQPKTSTLAKDFVLDRNHRKAVPPAKPVPPVAFTHEEHTTPAYSVDGKSPVGCAECHHTDQPKTALTGVLKTSHRDVLLTAALLTTPGAAPVYSCRACHAQVNTKPAICDGPQASRYAFCPNIPNSTAEDEGDVALTNEEAYHRNCINCHSNAVAARRKPGAPPFKKGTPPTACAACHIGL